jgi:predicted exporter
MGLRNYRILLQIAVSDMARCSGPYREKLCVAWINYIYKFDWDEFEALLMAEDMPAFQELKKRMVDDLHDAIRSRSVLLSEQFKDNPAALSQEAVSKYVNAEAAIRAMIGQRAKRSVEAIVEMYAVVVATVDHKETFLARSDNREVAR